MSLTKHPFLIAKKLFLSRGLNVGIPLFIFAIAVFKSQRLSVRVCTGSWRCFAEILSHELSIVGAVILLVGIAACIRLRVISFALQAIAACITFYYLCDAELTLTFNTRLTVPVILKYRSQWLLVLDFLKFYQWFLLVAAILLLRVSIRTTRRFAIIAASAGACLTLVPLVLRAAPPWIEPYLGLVISLPTTIDATPSSGSSYTEQETVAASAIAPLPIESPEKYPRHILLLLVEAMSAIDSERVSGLPGQLPHLDELSQDGILFTNFFANFYSTDGAMVALLHGTIPILYPGAVWNSYESFALPGAVIAELRKNGFYAGYVKAGELKFQESGVFMKSLPMDFSEGFDTMPELRSAPSQFPGHFGTDDAHLYAAILPKLLALGRAHEKYILAVSTMSSHVPYSDNTGKSADAHHVWQYVDDELGDFYQKLVQSGFFSDGTLILMGDHRKREPITRTEEERYGPTAPSRIPLVIIGPGIPKGKIDQRFFQQSDLLRKLVPAINGNGALSPEPILLNESTYSNFMSEQTADFTVASEAMGQTAGYRGSIYGRTITWRKEPPPNESTVEAFINQQRALHQEQRRAHPGCKFLPPTAPPPGAQNGIAVIVRDGTEIARVFENSNRAIVETKFINDFSFKAPAHPLTAVRQYNFSAALTAYLSVARAGVYEFRIRADDGACMFIDSKLLVDDSRFFQKEQTFDWDAQLDEGNHLIQIGYFQGGGASEMTVQWRPPGSNAWAPIPPNLLYAPQ